MSESWESASRVVVPAAVSPSVTVIAEASSEALQRIAEETRSTGVDLSAIELRASFAGPARSGGEIVGEILIVAQQVALGATGSGVWAGVQALLDRIRGRTADGESSDGHLALPTQILTIVVPTERGDALVRQVSLGFSSSVDIARLVSTLASGELPDS